MFACQYHVFIIIIIIINGGISAGEADEHSGRSRAHLYLIPMNR